MRDVFDDWFVKIFAPRILRLGTRQKKGVFELIGDLQHSPEKAA